LPGPITSAVNFFIQNADGSTKLSGIQYYLFFAALMLVTALVFIAVASRYRERTYPQEET